MTIRELYPEHIDRDLYTSALDQCVISGEWLLNNSGMDVFFEGFQKNDFGYLNLHMFSSLSPLYIVDL